MAKKHKDAREPLPKPAKKQYARELRHLQIELVKLHRHVISRVVREFRANLLGNGWIAP
jgi:hypothetical protein